MTDATIPDGRFVSLTRRRSRSFTTASMRLLLRSSRCRTRSSRIAR